MSTKVIGPVVIEDTPATNSVLSFFGISTSRSGTDRSVPPTFVISIESEASENNVQAIYDSTTKRWRLIGAQVNPTKKIRKGSLRRQSAAGGGIYDCRRDDDAVRASSNHIERPLTEDWTRFLPRTNHVDFLRSKDWAATFLGSMQTWSHALRLMTLKMLADPRPANLYW